jgi:tetratricopeptide (TPR) repeat protein
MGFFFWARTAQNKDYYSCLLGHNGCVRRCGCMPAYSSVKPFIASVVLVLLFACSLIAQEDSPKDLQRSVEDRAAKGSIRGRVVMPGGSFVNQSVKVSLLTLRGTEAFIYSDNQGWFEFSGLIPGNYEVQVETSGSEYEVVNQSVQVFRGAPSIITVSLRGMNKPAPRVTASTISVAELAAVPKDAKKEFELATKAAQENKTDKAVEHFRKAISIYPNFVMARSDLGAQLLAQGKLDEAEEELRAAIRLDEKAFNPKLNLGIVLVEQHEFVEAAEILGRALVLNPDSASAKLYDGQANAGIGNLDEAVKQFKAAYSLGGSSYALALFYLGQVYMNKGEREQAREAFEHYLQDLPSANNADQVRKLIAVLR